jgi:hypothetical protein
MTLEEHANAAELLEGLRRLLDLAGTKGKENDLRSKAFVMNTKLKDQLEEVFLQDFPELPDEKALTVYYTHSADELKRQYNLAAVHAELTGLRDRIARTNPEGLVIEHFNKTLQAIERLREFQHDQ